MMLVVWQPGWDDNDTQMLIIPLSVHPTQLQNQQYHLQTYEKKCNFTSMH